MNHELLRRLWNHPAFGRRDLDEALIRAAEQQVPWVHALAELGPEQAQALDAELATLPFPLAARLEPDRALLRRLPAGLCQRLAALPLGSDEARGVVQLALADPSDPHAPAEFAYHLGARVEVLRAPRAALFAVLARLPRRSTPAPGETLGASTPAAGPPRPSLEAVSRAAGSGVAALPVPDALLAATTPNEVVQALLAALGPKSLVVALREGGFEVLASGRRPSSREELGRFRLDPASPNTVSRALAAGFYWGPLQASEVDAALAWALELPLQEEVYAVPVLVAERPALVLIVAGLDSPFSATRRVDELARAAGEVLSELVRRKKRPRS